MPASMQTAPEMETENQQIPESNEPQSSQSGETGATENAETTESSVNELELPGWSIVTFEGVAMSGLTYQEARNWAEKLNAQKISGLCIVTDEAAARISK